MERLSCKDYGSLMLILASEFFRIHVLDDPLKVTARKFLKREHKPQDSSLWTETPTDREKRLKGQPKDDDYNEGSSSRSKRSRRQGSDDDEPTYRSQADIECEEQIRKYNVRNCPNSGCGSK